MDDDPLDTNPHKEYPQIPGRATMMDYGVFNAGLLYLTKAMDK
jgi:hypothetical protein